MDTTALAGLNPFGIFDVEAARLDHFFSGLDERRLGPAVPVPGLDRP